MSIRLIISNWIKRHGVKYSGGTVEIPASKQDVVVPELLEELKSNGYSAEDLSNYIPNIVSPLVPSSVKALKKIRKYNSMPDELLKKKLLQWCWSVSKNFSDIFNEIYFGNDSDKFIDFKEVYQAICKIKKIELPQAAPKEITDSDIEEHFNTPKVDSISICSKKESNKKEVLDAKNLSYDKIIIIDPNNLPEDYPEFVDVDLESLEYFGLSDVPKEKL